MSNKSIDELSAEELFELAKQKESEEQERERDSVRSRIEELKEMRRDLVAGHKKSLAAIDKEVKDLNKKLRKAGGAAVSSSKGGSRKSGATKTILEIIEKQGPISSADLKTQLEQAGLSTTNLNQQLNYLKRRGQVESPKRATYQLVK